MNGIVVDLLQRLYVVHLRFKRCSDDSRSIGSHISVKQTAMLGKFSRLRRVNAMFSTELEIILLEHDEIALDGAVNILLQLVRHRPPTSPLLRLHHCFPFHQHCFPLNCASLLLRHEENFPANNDYTNLSKTTNPL